MKANNSKIQDFGQKIGGARKDKYSRYKDMIAAITGEALAKNPLSKVFTMPDLRAL